MIKINCKKIKKGFTLAEMMVVLLIMSIIAAAMTPLITRKHRQLPNDTTHGRWECYYSGGQLYQKITTSSGSATTTAVSSCQFVPSKKAEYFIVQAVSGGGGGAGTVTTIPAYGVTNGGRDGSSTTMLQNIAVVEYNHTYTFTNPFSSDYKVSDAEYQSKVLNQLQLSFLATGGGGGASAIGSLYNDGGSPYVTPAIAGNGGGCQYNETAPVLGEIVQVYNGTGGKGGNKMGLTAAETYNGGPGQAGTSGTIKVTKAGTVVLDATASGGEGSGFVSMQVNDREQKVALQGEDGRCTGGATNILYSQYKTFLSANASTSGQGGTGANIYGGFAGNDGSYGCKMLDAYDVYNQCQYQYKTSTSRKKYLVYGAGGSAGAYQSVVLPSLNGAITVTIGQGGTGGIVNASSEDLAKGGTGGTTSFGNYLLVTGGAGGAVQYYTLNLSSTVPDPYTAAGLAGADSPLKDIYAFIYGAGGSGGSTTVTNNNVANGALQVFVNDEWTALGDGSGAKDTATVTPGANGESGSVVIIW